MYNPSLKGLMTESFDANAGEDTMLDCQDVVISQDSKIESRHGINSGPVSVLPSGDAYSVIDANVSVFKIPFSAAFQASSGYAKKYVILSKTAGNVYKMEELATTNALNVSLETQTSDQTSNFTAKPIAFSFGQSFYIMGFDGVQEMQRDTLNAGSPGVKKVINWPAFNDINIETFQDTNDFSTNWFNIDRKVGIRFTYVWNTNYNDETPREVESAPSQVFEVLHPMALRTQAAGSDISNTIKDQSRIRVRIGENFTQSIAPYLPFVTSQTNNRRYYIRIYRTAQVPIGQKLPTEYAIACPDIEVGASTIYSFSDSALISVANDTIDFGATNAARWKNGDLFRYISATPIGGLTTNTLYYLGQKSGTTFKVFNSPLVTAPINLTSTTAVLQNLVRVYESNITVNDDALGGLPKLYTNPNLDGEVNSNLPPPIANSLIEYKNHLVVANIREPLRAYISMVKQPFVKNVVAVKTIGANLRNLDNGANPIISTGNYFFTAFSVLAPDGVAADLSNNTEGLTSNDFGIDSPFFRRYPVVNCTFAGNAVTASTASDLPLAIAGGPTTSSSRLFFDANFVQTSARIRFKFTQGATETEIEAPVEPFYNRTSLYTRYKSLPGAFPYTGAITLDNNLDFLQFVGNLDRPRYGPMPMYIPPGDSVAFDGGITNRAVSVAKTNVRGGKLPTVRSTGSSVITQPSPNVVITNVDVQLSNLAEPGVFLYSGSSGSGYFSYKTFTMSAINTIQFNNVTFTGDNKLGTGTLGYGYAIDASSAITANLYFQQSPVTNGQVLDWINEGIAFLPILVAPIPLTGYYQSPIAIANSFSLDGFGGKLPNVFFNGNLAKSPAQLLIDSTLKLVQSLNEQVATQGAIASRVKFVASPAAAGEFYVEYTGGDKIESRITGDYHSYEPEIVRSASEFTKLAEYKQNNIRALSISRHNAPESFPAAQVLGPQLIGSDKSAIVALAKNADDCFVLKEDGIWRLSLVNSDDPTDTGLPVLDQIVQIDTTTFCQAPYSVQEINEEVIFLSQKGFISISGNSIQAIGRNIETEVKEKLQRSISKGLAGQIRSWVNEEKRIYGCTIPDTTVTFTTYIFNTYTREWTKSSLPILDATTDNQGRTTFIVGQYERNLDAAGTLQEQLNNSSTGVLTKFLLTEEVHTDGQYRNELDQYDYYFLPASAVDVGSNNVVLTNVGGLAPSTKLGGVGTNITQSGLQYFVGKQAYYSKSGVLYPCEFVSRTSTTCTVTFPGGIPPSIATIAGNDGLYAGVPASVTFNPTSVGTPDTNKQFSEYMVHVDEAISSLKMKFKTDSQASFSATRTFAFNTVAVNRSIYRTFIPITACRGRWFIRQVSHEVPLERLVITAQTINVRETGSARVQKAPR